MKKIPVILLLSTLLFLSSVRGYEFEDESSEEIESVRPGVYRTKEREPVDLDFVSGTIGKPDDTQVELAHKPQLPTFPNNFPFAPFPTHPMDTSSIFQHTFGDFFGDGAATMGGIGNNNGFHNFFPGFAGFGNFPQPWWKGANVCVERDEKVENQTTSDVSESNGDSMFVSGFHLNYETCVDKRNKHVCKTVTNTQGRVKTITVTRQCCHGYARLNNGPIESGCEKIDLSPITETAEKLGAKQFVRSAMNNGLGDEFKKNITIFVPLDSTFNEFSEQMFESNLVVLPGARSRRSPNDGQMVSSRDIIMAHIVDGWYNIEDIENEQLLQSNYGKSKIRMNIFPKAPSANHFAFPYKYTANCAPIVKANQIGTNGIVHVVENVLTPVEKSLMDIIRGRSDMKILQSILEKTKLDDLLTNNNSLTIFAPTDSAFDKLEPHFKRSLKEGNDCAISILKNHILDLTFCSCAVVSEAKTNTLNLLDQRLNFERKKSQQGNEVLELVDSDIMINGESRITETDLMATNGVLHVIDSIITTDSGLPITSVLEKRNLTVFKNLIEAGNFREEYEHLANVSFFVPSDKAFENSKWKSLLTENPTSLKNNEELKAFLDYHVAQPLIRTCDFNENEMKTKNGLNLRINLYTTHPIFTNIMNRATVNCARLIHFDDESCGSVLHQVDKVLEPSNKNLLQTLESNNNYSMFLRFIREANLTKLLEDMDEDLTLFVPKDDVFREVSQWYEDMLQNREELVRIVKAHILPDVLCCSGIVQSDWPFIRSVATINNIHLKMDRDRRPKIQNAGITKCDINAKNGIIHEINDIISIRPRQTQQPIDRFW